MDINIKDLIRQTSTGLVLKAVYSFSKTSGDHTVSYKIPDIYFAGDADANDFIPYEDLTASTVEGWIRNALTQQQLDEIEDVLNHSLAEIEAPTTSSGLPWD